MKFLYILIGIIFLQSCEKKSLKENEILEIIHSNEGYENMNLKKDFLTGNEFVDSLKPFRKILNEENFKPIYEADFNNDGKMDYLVNLSYQIVSDYNNVVKPYTSEHNYNSALLMSDDDGYKLLNPGEGKVYEIIASKIIKFKNQPLIKLISHHQGFDDSFHIFDIDTLTVKNNLLTEYNSNNKKHKIEKIIFTKSKGYSPLRVYQLTLTKDSVTLDSDSYKNLKGYFLGDNNSSFQKLANHLNEINFLKLREQSLFPCCN